MADSLLDEAARRFAKILAGRKQSKGVQPAPSIEVDETTLEPLAFGLELAPGGIGGGGGGGGLAETFFILMEDDSFILMQSGFGILTEDAP